MSWYALRPPFYKLEIKADMEKILPPSQAEEDLSCSSDSGSSGNEERPWVFANEGSEGSPDELATALKDLHDARVKQRRARKGVWRYLGYGKLEGVEKAKVN